MIGNYPYCDGITKNSISVGFLSLFVVSPKIFCTLPASVSMFETLAGVDDIGFEPSIPECLIFKSRS